MPFWLNECPVISIVLLMKGQTQLVSVHFPPLAMLFNETYSIKYSAGKHRERPLPSADIYEIYWVVFFKMLWLAVCVPMKGSGDGVPLIPSRILNTAWLVFRRIKCWSRFLLHTHTHQWGLLSGGWLIILASMESMEWSKPHGNHMFDNIPLTPFQSFLWAVLTSAASTDTHNSLRSETSSFYAHIYCTMHIQCTLPLQQAAGRAERNEGSSNTRAPPT